MQQEWVEVRGPSVEEAVQAGLDELGIGSADQAEIEVIQEPKRRFMVRVQDAVVRIKAKPATKKRRRRRRKGGRGGERESGDSGGSPERSGASGSKGQQRSGGGERGQGRSKGGKSEDRRQQRGGSQAGKPKPRGEGRGAGQRKQERNEGGSVATSDEASAQEPAQPAKPDPAEQAEVVAGFLRGLLEAFGLEGSVSSRVEDGAIFVDVTGEQTEALVGPKGAIMQAIHELSRTVVQRKTFGGARLRLDIAGYAARRHKALEIYAARLADQIKQDGEEVMLEPMNPADRKVVHDAVAGIEGVRTYSEGEEPNRSVIISLAPGFDPIATAESPDDDAPVADTATAESPGDNEDMVDGDPDGSDSESE